jgi:hypothetical protein
MSFSAMKGDKVKFKKDGKFVRGTIDKVFFKERTFEYDEEPIIEGFAVSRMVGDTEYVTYEENVVFV